jgi:hypothetical protein
VTGTGGVILVSGHRPWCLRNRWGEGDIRRFEGACDCGNGQAVRPRTPQSGTGHRMIQCSKCFVIEELAYLGWEKILASGFCFNCHFWQKRIEERGPGTVIVNGTHYEFDVRRPVVGGRTDFLGHGGSKFEIWFHDGRRFVTNNLWCQGSVPHLWLPLFQDNAIFVARNRAIVVRYKNREQGDL